MLAHLNIARVRNLHELDLHFNCSVATFTGANGAGKTSILEAVHLLSTGRSFKSREVSSLVNHDAESCRVVGKLETKKGLSQTLGVEWSRRDGLRARRDGDNVKSMAELASLLPVIALDTRSLALLEEGPVARRRLIDQLMFHVEPDFLVLWRDYNRSLKQRNFNLRSGHVSEDDAWRSKLALAGERVELARRRGVGRLQTELEGVLRELSSDLGGCVALEALSGWRSEISLEEALWRAERSDHSRGYTQVGPHRGDISIAVGGRPAKLVVSRGQLRVLLTALKIAVGRLVDSVSREPSIYVADDLLSELDASNTKSICDALVSQGNQVFTSMVSSDTAKFVWGGMSVDLFHVERGQVSILD